MRVDGIKRAGGREGGFAAVGLDDQPRCEEGLQNLLRELGRDAEFGGHLLYRHRRPAGLEPLADACHQPECDEFPPALVHVFDELVLQIGFAVLERIRDLRTKQQYDPRKINSRHEHRQQAEAAIHFAVGHEARDVEKAEDVVQIPQRTADDAADERRAESDFCVWHEQIKESEREPQNEERQQFKNQTADEGHFCDDSSCRLQMRAACESERADDGERSE